MSTPTKAEVFAHLKELGAVTAVVSYYGEGDDGSINDVTAQDRDGKNIKLHAPSAAYSALTSFSDEAIEKHFGGYENNEGVTGTLTFFVEAKDKHPAQSVVLEHAWYVTKEEAEEPVLL